MARERVEMHQMLKKLFPENQEPHVYFQPPQNTKIIYPCMIYKLSDMPQKWANNLPYHWERAYELTYITQDPNDPMAEKLIALRETKFNRYFSADNLHHFVYIIFD